MYQRYADGQSWKIAHLSESAAENGGLKEAIVQVSIHHLFLQSCALSGLPVQGAQKAGVETCKTSAAVLQMIIAWHVLWFHKIQEHCEHPSSASRKGKPWAAPCKIIFTFISSCLNYRTIVYVCIGSTQEHRIGVHKG